jgi:hypothetical protein
MLTVITYAETQPISANKHKNDMLRKRLLIKRIAQSTPPGIIYTGTALQFSTYCVLFMFMSVDVAKPNG